MSRFSENFNDIDPASGRPFSFGHPDGVWVIAILYSIILIISVGLFIAGLFKLILSQSFEVGFFLAACINFGLFLPPILFLFRRSDKAIGFSLAIFFIFFAATAISSTSADTKFYIPLFLVCIQGYICYYMYGLKKDGLLEKKT